MSVLNPRNRLVNFRLSEVEFEDLKAACARQGARSISDFARSSVLRCLEDSSGDPDQSNGRLENLDQKVNELETRVEQLLRLVGVTTMEAPEVNAGATIMGEGGES